MTQTFFIQITIKKFVLKLLIQELKRIQNLV